jgi:dihydrofolate reductase
MARIVLYIATSPDGFIAAPPTSDDPGGVKWLEPYRDALEGFPAFLKSIGAAVMGRKTYDFVATQLQLFGSMPLYVVTHRPLGDTPASANLVAFAGDAPGLAARVRKDVREGDAWLVGGGQIVRAFADADQIDEWIIHVVPVLLGDGIPLLPPSRAELRSLRLAGTSAYGSGVVELRYLRR